MTPAELELLRLPLVSLPGFDPRGLDLHFPAGSGAGAGAIHQVTALRPYDGAWLGWADEIEAPNPIAVEVAELHLADRSTRNRVAEWLAAQVSQRPGCTAPSWRPVAAWGGFGWVLSNGTRHRDVLFHGAPVRKGWGPRRRVWVPGLATLDHRDRRPLPDGACFVDALSLTWSAKRVGELGPESLWVTP